MQVDASPIRRRTNRFIENLFEPKCGRASQRKQAAGEAVTPALRGAEKEAEL